MSDRPTLDVPSFEALLAAAWVLQCEHDAEVRLASKGSVAALSSRHGQHAPDSSRGLLESTSAFWPVQRPVASPQCPASPWRLRVVVPASAWRTLRTARSSVGPLLVLLILVTFFLSETLRRDSTSFVAEAAPSTEHTVSSGALDRRGSPKLLNVSAVAEIPSLGPSHKQVTDEAALSVVNSLSRYEINGLQRQARYGDDQAALTLGMAYELGRPVSQSCRRAANWTRIAAEGGNAAAQYNLGLRYLYGDGIAVDTGEARKWLQAAAASGYSKAQPALQALGVQSGAGQ